MTFEEAGELSVAALLSCSAFFSVKPLINSRTGKVQKTFAAFTLKTLLINLFLPISDLKEIISKDASRSYVLVTDSFQWISRVQRLKGVFIPHNLVQKCLEFRWSNLMWVCV